MMERICPIYPKRDGIVNSIHSDTKDSLSSETSFVMLVRTEQNHELHDNFSKVTRTTNLLYLGHMDQDHTNGSENPESCEFLCPKLLL